jgi:hypothetical protein
MFKIVCLALLVLVASASTKKFMDTKAVLAQIDQDKFGNVMLSAI